MFRSEHIRSWETHLISPEMHLDNIHYALVLVKGLDPYRQSGKIIRSVLAIKCH